MTIVTVGIDLAKNVFALHGVDESGKPVLVRPEVARAKMLELIAHLPPCHDRHGSVFRRPPLGQTVRQVWAHGTHDSAQVCDSLAVMRQLLNVVHQAIQMPPRVHLGVASELEPV